MPFKLKAFQLLMVVVRQSFSARLFGPCDNRCGLSLNVLYNIIYKSHTVFLNCAAKKEGGLIIKKCVIYVCSHEKG